MQNKNSISIIVPFLNEEDVILDYCTEIDRYAANKNYDIEIIFVDDGSTDNSVSLLESYTFEYVARVQLISLSKNFGSHAAIRVGIKNATGAITTWMGCDLQEPLDFIDKAFEKIELGYDVIYIEKTSVPISAIGRGFSLVYAKLVRKYAVPNYASNSIGTIVFNSKVKSYLNDNIESNSSILLQIINIGFKNITIPLDYNERMAGVSKWTMKKKIKLFIDSFVSFSFMPIRLVSIVGIIIFLIGLLIGIGTLINKIVNPEVPIGYSTLTSIMALGFGVTNISLGIIAEYLWRTYDAARNRPQYVVSEKKQIKGEN